MTKILTDLFKRNFVLKQKKSQNSGRTRRLPILLLKKKEHEIKSITTGQSVLPRA
jgi:hypothetical protein